MTENLPSELCKLNEFIRQSSAKKDSENSSPVSFSDLPMDVVEEVVKKLNLLDCLSLRKVSRGLRELVDTSDVNCDVIDFYFGLHGDRGLRSSRILFDNGLLGYEETDGGCKVVWSKGWKIRKYEGDRSFQHTMLADVSTFLKNPKLQINSLSFSFCRGDTSSEFVEFLQSLDSPLNVRSVYIHTDRVIVAPILRCLKAQTLEEIRFDDYSFAVEQFDEIVATEQWKAAKTLDCNRVPRGFGMENLLHFERIVIQRYELSYSDLVMVRDTLLPSAHFESCYFGMRGRNLYNDLDLDLLGIEIWEGSVEDTIDLIMSQNSAYNAQSRRYSIPDSRDYFQFEFEKDHRDIIYALKITKNKKE